jgi:Tol biopolymer transport system component
VNANGTGVPTVLVRDEADDVYPVISPDGQYLAFSSNRQGAYNIFVKPLFTEELWQLTSAAENAFVGGWK